ncbi:serine/threonine-protein kinase pakG-like isoform X1 [Pieris napi]|uniref:serine/threonine-protein kinase pakG-like isoform X1 n=1 Tax=Pieris napi TaxID=78633 RepID=UPI001FB8D0B5|nr:serine/threonine-protein kinase pakG-like isoform X1 [Pieris napi]
MEGKALILTLVFAVVNCHAYYGKDRPDSIFHTLPHMLHDMIKGHRGNNYNQQPDTNNFNPDPYGSRLNSGYQQNNMGYQNLGQSGYNIPKNQGLDPELNDPSEGLGAGNPSNYNTEITTPLTTTEQPREMLHLSTNPPLALNSSAPIDFNTDTAHSSNIKRDINGLTNNKLERDTSKPRPNNKNHNTMHIETDKSLNIEPTLNKEKEYVRVNKPRNPNAIVFPDNMEEVKREVQGKHNSNASELPNRFNDTPQILYAVNIAPSDTNQWNRNPSAPLTNPITQPPPLTNTQAFGQNPNQASYATLISPNQTPLINKVAEPNPFGNSIVLPNANGGSSLYTIVNLPNSVANANIPSQMFQSTDVISNPSSYQVQNSIPTANSGIINGMPTYYVVSVPNQSSQTIQTSVPYTNAPVRYTVGYISSNGQTVLVPSSPVVYQIIPQNFVPISQSNYVPVSSGQQNVIAQPLATPGNAAVTYVPVSNSVSSGQQTYMTVPNSQGNVPNSQINYVPVTNGQGNMASQPNYVTVSNGQENTGTQINVVPGAQENTPNTQINYVPVSSGQENSASQPNYVTVTSGQGNTGSQLNLVPVSNSQGNTQNYVPVSSDQSNVVTLTSAPSETMVLPADTQSVTLLSFKDKDEEKSKKKPSKKKSKKK